MVTCRTRQSTRQAHVCQWKQRLDSWPGPAPAQGRTLSPHEAAWPWVWMRLCGEVPSPLCPLAPNKNGERRGLHSVSPGASCWEAGLRSPLVALSLGPTLPLCSKRQLHWPQAGLPPPGQWAHLMGLGLLEGAGAAVEVASPGHSCPQVTWNHHDVVSLGCLVTSLPVVNGPFCPLGYD